MIKTYQIAVLLGTYIISAWSLSFTFHQNMIQDSNQDTVPRSKVNGKSPISAPPIIPPALNILNSKEEMQKKKLDSLAKKLDTAAEFIEESNKTKNATENLLDDTDKRHRNTLKLISHLDPKPTKQTIIRFGPMQPVQYKIEDFKKPVLVADLVAPIEPVKPKEQSIIKRLIRLFGGENK